MSTEVTRTEIARYVATAFDGGGAETSELVAAATLAQAPPAVIQRLHALPELRVPHLRNLWQLMPEVPVE